METIIENIKKEARSILERNDTDFAAVFGSHAKGEADKDSDVDILIRFAQPKSLFEIARIEEELSDSLGRNVDLVTENSLSPYIKDEIISSSKIVYGER